MLSGEDYVVVWVGAYKRLASEGQRELFESKARRAGLQTWHDTFETDEVTGPLECLLIGRLVTLLGVKEQRFRLDLSPARFDRLLESVRRSFARIHMRPDPKLLVLLHVEDPDA